MADYKTTQKTAQDLAKVQARGEPSASAQFKTVGHGEETITLTASLTTADFIYLAKTQIDNLQIVPEESRIRCSASGDNVTFQLQYKNAAGSWVNVTSTAAVTNAVVTHSAAATTALPVLPAGTELRYDVTAVTTSTIGTTYVFEVGFRAVGR